MLRRPALALSTAALAAALLTGWVDDGVGNGAERVEGAAQPVQTLPPRIVELAATDVGQFIITPRKDVDEETLDATVATIKQLPGVQTSQLESDGTLNLEFRPGASTEEREEALKQAGALGEIAQGI